MLQKSSPQPPSRLSSSGAEIVSVGGLFQEMSTLFATPWLFFRFVVSKACFLDLDPLAVFANSVFSFSDTVAAFKSSCSSLRYCSEVVS